MQQQSAWAKALNIPKAQYDEWKMIAPTEESFTFWCLHSGRIVASKYFAWAKDHYGFALLNDKYFSLQPNMDFWKMIHTVANWSPWMLPLEQWDGVIFIGCVEPPSETAWSFPVCYVLAQPGDLEKLWQRYHGTSESVAAGTQTINRGFVTETISSNTKTLFNLPHTPEPAPVVTSFKFELADTPAEPAGVPGAPEGFAIPTGISFDFSKAAPSSARERHSNLRVWPASPCLPPRPSVKLHSRMSLPL